MQRRFPNLPRLRPFLGAVAVVFGVLVAAYQVGLVVSGVLGLCAVLLVGGFFSLYRYFNPTEWRQSMSAETVDLHGAKGQPYPSFGEDWSYLERVTITDRAEAQETLARESGMNPEEHDPQPIFMRHVNGEQMQERSDGEFDEGWLECSEHDADAVPFWKDAP